MAEPASRDKLDALLDSVAIRPPIRKRNPKAWAKLAKAEFTVAVVVVALIVAALALSTGKRGSTVDATSTLAPDTTTTVDPQAQCSATVEAWVTWITNHGSSGGFILQSDIQTNVSSFRSVVGINSALYQPVVQIVYSFTASEDLNGAVAANAAALQAEASACVTMVLGPVPFPDPPTS